MGAGFLLHPVGIARRRSPHARAVLLIASLAGLAWLSLGAAPGPRCTSASTCLEMIARAQGEVGSLRAKFVQTKHVSLLTSPLVSRGHFAFRRPDLVLWQVDEPEPMRIVVRGGSLDLPGLSAEERAAIAASPMANLYRDLGAVFTGDIKTLERSFTVTAHAESEDVDLRLEPRDERARRALSEVEVRFSGEAMLPARLAIKESLGDSVEVVLTEVERNPPLADEIFAPPEANE